MPTMVKGTLDDRVNEAVEKYQQENNCSKPEAVEALIEGRVKYLGLL